MVFYGRERQVKVSPVILCGGETVLCAAVIVALLSSCAAGVQSPRSCVSPFNCAIAIFSAFIGWASRRQFDFRKFLGNRVLILLRSVLGQKKKRVAL